RIRRQRLAPRLTDAPQPECPAVADAQPQPAGRQGRRRGLGGRARRRSRQHPALQGRRQPRGSGGRRSWAVGWSPSRRGVRVGRQAAWGAGLEGRPQTAGSAGLPAEGADEVQHLGTAPGTGGLPAR
ncbi:unnamed protein product, partial [Prorocentrum cordatum]